MMDGGGDSSVESDGSLPPPDGRDLAELDGEGPVQAACTAANIPQAVQYTGGVEVGCTDTSDVPRMEGYEATSLPDDDPPVMDPEEVVAQALKEHGLLTPEAESIQNSVEPLFDPSQPLPPDIDALIDEELGFDPLDKALKERQRELLQAEEVARCKRLVILEQQEELRKEHEGRQIAAEMAAEFDSEVVS